MVEDIVPGKSIVNLIDIKNLKHHRPKHCSNITAAEIALLKRKIASQRPGADKHETL